MVRGTRGELRAARGHPGRTLRAVPLGIHPRGRRRGRHDPMEALPRLPGADAAAGHGRPAPTGRPLHATHGGDPQRQRQTPRRVERSGGDGRLGARQPRLRLAERQGMPRRHGQGIRDRSDAGRIFLFRHAPDPARGRARLGGGLRREKGLRVRLHGQGVQPGADAQRRRVAGGVLQRSLRLARAREARLPRLHVFPAYLRTRPHRVARQRRRLGRLLQRARGEALRPHGSHGHPFPALPAEGEL